MVAAIAVLAYSTLIGGDVSTAPRRIPEGALTPEFSAVDTAGRPFIYARSSGKALVLAFLSSQKKQSQEAVEDMCAALSSIPSDRLASLQVAFVLQDVDDEEFVASIRKGAPAVVQILDDERYDMWGKFGVIAMPTVLIADPQGTVLCVKSGHAYDFVPTVKSSLCQALEIPCDIRPDEGSNARTVANDTTSARARRHLQMAKSLASKGRVIPAIEQARIAQEMDPNLTEVALELGELLCRAGRPQEAIDLANTLSVDSRQDRARISLALGWAHRQMGRLEEAERFLLEGVRLDATSHRLFFELGRVYQDRDDSERAMQAYFRALTLIYGEDLR